jgi:hypothetical protein
MSSQQFNSLLAESQPSLCIPRVFNNITELRIRKIFNELSLGKISRIDINEHKNEKGTFNRVYIHFEKWFLNEEAQLARRKLILGKEIKIIYDDPWFWKVSASKWEPPTKSKYLQVKVPSKKKSTYIEFDNEFGRDLSLTNDYNTDEFGRDLSLTNDLNNTNKFGRDLSVKIDLNNTDEFGRDLIRIIRPVAIIEPEQVFKEKIFMPFVSIMDDVDDLNIPKFVIDYGIPFPVPKKMIKRTPLNKNKNNNVQPKETEIPKDTATAPKKKQIINWCDADSDTDEEEIDIYADL